MTETAPLPKSPMSSGSGKVPNWATGYVVADGGGPDEDAALEAGGQLRGDAVRADGRHYSAPAVAGGPAAKGKTSSSVRG